MKTLKRILIISANPLSDASNNGKTIASFFDSYPKELIAQLYFYPTAPSSKACDNYFRISDIDMVKSRFLGSKQCGTYIASGREGTESLEDVEQTKRVRKNNFSRLMREFLWNENWKTQELEKWLDAFHPELIFFVAGDAWFSYKITFYIKKRYHTKLAVFITDDYILPRFTVSVFWWIRRNVLYGYMKKGLNMCDVFFTISPAMRKKYYEVFGVDSYTAVNMPELSVGQGRSVSQTKKDSIILVHTGSLHSNRDKTLRRLAKAIDEINSLEALGKKVVLEIYSYHDLDLRKKKKLEISGSSIWGGCLSQEELERKFQEADYLVYAESFEHKSVHNMLLSLSTKIPEYMMLKKPIIAVGSNKISAIQYLSDCACCITKKTEIRQKLYDYLKDTALQKRHVEKAYLKFLDDYDKQKKQKEFLEILQRV